MIRTLYTLACLALLPFLPALLAIAGVPFGGVDNLGVILGVGFGINLDDMLASRMGRKANALIAGCVAGGTVNLLTDFAGAWFDPAIRGHAWGILLGCALPLLLIPFLSWLQDWRDARRDAQERLDGIQWARAQGAQRLAQRPQVLVCDICRARADVGTARDALGEWLCSRCRRETYTNAGSLNVGDVVTVPALDPRTNKRDAEHGNPFVVVRLDPRSEYVPITLQGLCDAPVKRFPTEVVEWEPSDDGYCKERERVLAAIPGVLRAYDIPHDGGAS
jgi:ribosomal protein L37AE/L43A